MIFGSNEFFGKLKTGMALDAGEKFYAEVLQAIEKDIYPKVTKHVNYPDSEDVIQQVLVAVWISLAKYVMTSENHTPAQRNAWLNRIVNNKIADYYRECYSRKEDITADEILLNLARLSDVPDMVIEDREDRFAQQECLDKVIQFICSMNVAPEKIIAFFYSKVIYFLSAGGTLKGSAKYAVKMIRGKTLGELWSVFRSDFEDALGRRVPDYVFQPLFEKIQMVNEYGYIIDVEVEEISDSTNYIVKRIRKAKDYDAAFEVK